MVDEEAADVGPVGNAAPACRPEPLVQWWLAAVDQYGNPRLVDGSHSALAGVEKALYLLNRLGLSRGTKYMAARIELTDVTPAPHGSNEDALTALNGIGLRPK